MNTVRSVCIKCPARVNLFLNVNGINETKKLHSITAVNQTIDMYDYITITELPLKRNTEKNINILSNNLTSETSYEDFYCACNIFFAYTNITPNNLHISIFNDINVLGLGNKASNIAGILLGLNTYYKTGLANHELRYLASLINFEAPYFITGGYAKITGCGENIKSLDSDNPYKFYLILIPNMNISTVEMFASITKDNLRKKIFQPGIIHNDFNDFMPDELKRLRNFLLKYPNIEHSLSGVGPAYFVASKSLITNELKRTLKYEFPNFDGYIRRNCHGHKIITKIL